MEGPVAGHAGADHCPFEVLQSILGHFRNLGGVFGEFVSRTFATRFATQWTCERTGRSGFLPERSEELCVLLDKAPSVVCAVRSLPRTWQGLHIGGRTGVIAGIRGFSACLRTVVCLIAVQLCLQGLMHAQSQLSRVWAWCRT